MSFRSLTPKNGGIPRPSFRARAHAAPACPGFCPYYDLARQPRIARQAEDIAHAVGFTPRHQPLAAEAAVGAQQDPHPRPAGTDLANDACDFLHGPSRAIDVGAAQLFLRVPTQSSR